MSGWVQLLVLVALLAIAYRPLGDYMAWVYSTDRPLRVERWIYRVAGVDPAFEQRWTGYAMSLLAFSVCSVLLAVHPPAGAGEPAPVAGLGWRPPRPGVQHRRLVPHEHELAVVLGRDDDGAPGPDDGARRPELPVGGGRDGRRHRPRPGIHARRGGHDRQLLVRHGAIHRADPAPDRVRVRARLHLAGGRPEPARVPHRPHRDRWHPGDPGRAGGLAGGDQGARQQRGRLLQRQLRPSVREPQPADELHADLPDPRDPVRVDRHVRQAGRQPQAGIRARGRDGRSSGSAAR